MSSGARGWPFGMKIEGFCEPVRFRIFLTGSTSFWVILDQLGPIPKVFGSSESVFEVLMVRLGCFKRVCGLLCRFKCFGVWFVTV